MGHGIPDFRKAFELLDEAGAATWTAQTAPEALIFPNPSSDGILRWLYKGDEPPTAWQLFDAGGYLLDEGNVPAWSTAEGHFQGHTRIAGSSPNGTYIFQLTGSDGVLVSRRWVLMR
jgi:hypothetical protein